MGPASRLESLTAMLTDTFHWHSAILQAEMQAAAGGSVYFYEFAWETPCFGRTWAPHGVELPFVFGNLTYPTAWDGHDSDALRAADDPPATGSGSRTKLCVHGVLLPTLETPPQQNCLGGSTTPTPAQLWSSSAAALAWRTTATALAGISSRARPQ